MVAPSRTLKYPESEIGDFNFSSPIGSGMKIRILKPTLFSYVLAVRLLQSNFRLP